MLSHRTLPSFSGSGSPHREGDDADPTGTIVPPNTRRTRRGRRTSEGPAGVLGAGVREGGRSAIRRWRCASAVLRSSVLMSVNSLTGGMTSGSSFVLLVFTMLRPREPGGKVRAGVRKDHQGRRSGHAVPVEPPQAITPPDRPKDVRRRTLSRARASRAGDPRARQRARLSRRPQGGLDHVLRNPSRHQRADHGSTTRSLDPESVVRDLASERLVIDQAHPFEAFEDVRDLLGLESTWSSRRSSSRRLRARTASRPRARSWQLFGCAALPRSLPRSGPPPRAQPLPLRAFEGFPAEAETGSGSLAVIEHEIRHHLDRSPHPPPRSRETHGLANLPIDLVADVGARRGTARARPWPS